MFRARSTLARFNFPRTRHFFCSKSTNSSSGSDKIESYVSKYNEAYRQLDKLDFMTAAKILFSEQPKKRKFGIDFHLVQLFFVCLPSLAVYLVAQYARHEMRKMDAELELKKKKEEEEKAKEMELKAIEEKKARSDPDLLEVKVRLDKLEETVKEITVESKKKASENVTKNQEDFSKKKASESSDTQSTAESSKTMEKDRLSKQTSIELPSDKGKVTALAPTFDASQEDQKGKTESGGTPEDVKK